MSRGLKSKLIEFPNKWFGSEETGTWEYGNYRYCYLTVRKLDNGKYRPNVGAFGDIPTPDAPLPKEGYFQFDTFEEAAKHVFKYVDWIRNVWDEEAKILLHNDMNRLMPHIYPKGSVQSVTAL
jgi:hypothetical protein